MLKFQACAHMLFVWHSNAKWSTPLFKFVIWISPKLSHIYLPQDWKDTNEFDLKLVKGSKNISCKLFTWVNKLITCTKSMTKTCVCATFIKFFTIWKGDNANKAQENLNIRCSKLEAITLIVMLSDGVFNNNGQYSCNTYLNGFNIEI